MVKKKREEVLEIGRGSIKVNKKKVASYERKLSDIKEKKRKPDVRRKTVKSLGVSSNWV